MRTTSHSTRRWATALGAALGALTVACADAPTAPSGPASAPAEARRAPPTTAVQEVFGNYVAIGTSISMGWASDGAIAESQRASWPAQLRHWAIGGELDQPFLAGTGCRSPLMAPLASGRRISGELALTPPAQLSCSALEPGVTLPTHNVAINAAKTSDALFTTPTNVTDASNRQLYARVLPPDRTQVGVMMAYRPTFVSVEFGGNEVLDARVGFALPGVTVVPVTTWAPLYRSVIDSVQTLTDKAVLVGLIDDVRSFPAFRTGDELWAQRAQFLGAFHVAVAPDCQGSENLLFVPVRVPTAVAQGASHKASGQPPAPLSCANAPAPVQDYVLGPADVATINGVLREMNAYVRKLAGSRGYAFFRLQALYGRPEAKPPFQVIPFMTSTQPYGTLISLDGVHPSAAGQTVLAAEAARVLNERYGFGIVIPASAVATR